VKSEKRKVKSGAALLFIFHLKIDSLGFSHKNIYHLETTDFYSVGSNYPRLTSIIFSKTSHLRCDVFEKMIDVREAFLHSRR
jgi:hypothetical protein